ncbi:hypothetical protein L8106_10116 [Lyngbya sp. PCC 8106]|nr:hypothetical protein L8106_10116 [Lyngbya sp. PCC 8106]
MAINLLGLVAYLSKLKKQVMAEIFGTEGADSLVGTSEPDSIFGLDGGDTLQGSQEGGDTLIGGLGNDFLFVNGNNNWVFAGKGDDIIEGRFGADTIFGDIGNDIINANAGNDLIFGNNDQDQINAGNGDDTIFGGQGNDDIDAGIGNDLIFGDIGNDRLRGGGGSDQFVIGSGFGTDVISDYGNGTDRILLQGGITEADLDFVEADIVEGSGIDMSIILRSTGETLAILQSTTVEEFSSSGVIEPLIL